MAKAILIINMPTACAACTVCQGVAHDGYVCSVLDSDGNERSHEDGRYSKPDWCPLVPMPSGKNWGSGTLGELHYCRGWNAAIDTIGGKESDRK